MDLQIQLKETVKVTVIGAVINIILSILKIAFGYITKANSVLADGIHSLSDLISDGFIIIFLKLSYQPPTRNRPYGNRKLESFASLLVAVILVVVVPRAATNNASASIPPLLFIEPVSFFLHVAVSSIRLTFYRFPLIHLHYTDKILN